ncbi:MAG: dihydroorotase [Gammaproteobacteria bacterium]
MKLTITQPDDMHLHVRDGEALEAVIGHTARQFARAIIMPNLKPPVTNVRLADAYRKRILAALPDKYDFQPLMTLYLTDNTTADEIEAAANCGFIHAIKYYPAGATTNSDSGVTDLKHTWSALEAMQKYGLPLLLHGEVTDPEIDIFDREAVFIERHLSPLVAQFPALKIVFEHLTTTNAVQFVESAADTVAATITAHHLLYNRNAMLTGGIRPHYYCLPILKREQHRQSLLTAATNGNPKFFAGTDSAPHPVDAKESACGCAGMYTAHAAMEFYAQAFEQVNALDKLEGFTSYFGADFYALPRNSGTITLEKMPQKIPASYSMGASHLVPLGASETIPWQALA